MYTARAEMGRCGEQWSTDVRGLRATPRCAVHVAPIQTGELKTAELGYYHPHGNLGHGSLQVPIDLRILRRQNQIHVARITQAGLRNQF